MICERCTREIEGALLLQSDKAQRASIELEAIRYFKPLWNTGSEDYLFATELREQFPKRRRLHYGDIQDPGFVQTESVRA